VNGVRPYERRRRGPVVVLASLLAVAAALTWTVVLTAAGGATPVSCPSPTAGAGGEALELNALDATPLAPVNAVGVRVLNAGGQRGQANLVAAQLRDLGFREAGPPGTDPLFPDGEMTCLGQLRFGPRGEQAAATLALVLPCLEPIRDGRGDATVDVSVGTEFREVDPAAAVRQVLDELAKPPAAATSTDPEADAGDPATDPSAAPVRPAAPPDVLQSARGDIC
jgi:hypothetical protein